MAHVGVPSSGGSCRSRRQRRLSQAECSRRRGGSGLGHSQRDVAYLGEREVPGAVDREELGRRLHEEGTVVIDVRPRLEYEAGHIPGARCIPLAELDEALRTLPRNIEVVAYCRGPYCVYADEAVRRLRAAGYRARRLQDGYPE